MPVDRRARWGAGLALLGAAAAGLALAFAPLVRSRVVAEAAKRDVDVVVGGARPGWFSLVLSDVRVKLRGVDALDVTIPTLRLELAASLSPKEVHLQDGVVTLVGDPDEVLGQLRAWRGEARSPAEGAERARLVVHAERMRVRWERGGDSLGVEGLDVTRDDSGVRATLDTAKVRLGPLGVSVGSGVCDLDGLAKLRRVKLATADVTWTLPDTPREGPPPAPPATGELAPPPLPAGVPTRAVHRGGKAAAPEPSTVSAESPEPLVPLPDLHALRGLAASAAAAIGARLPEGAEVAIDGLRLRLEQGGEERVSLGPGPLAVERHSTRVEITFSTGGSPAGTPLAVHAVLPSDDGDVEVSLAGGQVPLSLLGLHAKALTEVDRATFAGKGRVVLEGKGTSLTFDGELSFRGLAAHEPRLAADVVRGIDVEARARGVVSDRGELRVDDIEAAMGALRVEARGGFQQDADHVAAALSFEVPLGQCGALLDSLPTALVPDLRGAHMSGTLAARGRLAFDTRRLDDMALDYTIEDRCALLDVPGELEHDRFTKPFVHRVYTPDGKLSEEMTGPTTDGWTDLEHISPFMQAAVLTTEDGGFFHHHGFSHGAIRGALLANIKARRFVRGASTITMQLAKNLFLSRDKTLSRKLEELILTDYLEQAFTKEEMMELYLNVIEFGPNIYGVTAAADHYFGRRPDELNLAECMFLSSILPQPVHYHSFFERGDLPEAWLRGIRARMNIAERTGKITTAELAEGLTETVVFHRPNTPRPAPRPPVLAREGDADDPGVQLN